MLARRSLPAGYVLSGTLRLKGNSKLLGTLMLLALPWTLVSAVGFAALSSLVRPQGWSFNLTDVSPVSLLAVAVGGLVVTPVVVIVLHEVVHGVLLWTFTGARPVIGYKGWYAYADAPGWFLPRWPMVAVLLAPLIGLPAIGLPLVASASSGLSLLILCGLWFNTIAAIGDLYMTWIVLRIRGPVYFGDTPGAKPGEAGSWYLPGPQDVLPATTPS
jgi:Putative zincin peptidase